MALEVTPLNSKVQIQFDMGSGTDGKKVYRYRTLNNVVSDADDQDIYDVVSALIGLQSNTASGIKKIAQSELENL